MIKTDIFDVLVVYSSRLAVSVNSAKLSSTPFPKGSKRYSYNIVYSCFLKTCRKNNLKAAFTTSADIVAAGKCSGYWIFKNDSWQKVKKPAFSKLIFDKFSPVNQKIETKRKLLFSSHKIKPFNQPELFDLFFDKQKTYKKLAKFSIPTTVISGSTAKSIKEARKTLKKLIKKHPNQNDFSSDIVMKDRFGAGGISVYKFCTNQNKKIVESLKKHQNKSFIIQAFVKFDKGYSYRKLPISTDIRLIYMGEKIVQSYIRMAKAGDFRCNEHQGGTLKYIPISQVPANLIATSGKIAMKLGKKSSLFALDFIISNNKNIYLVEGNTGPGLDWDLSVRKNEIESKRLIGIVVKKLFKLSRPLVVSKPRKEIEIGVIDSGTTDESLTFPLGEPAII
jgi:glutathione synthase/RimK-type ligase-like ATP-grasp enzyme